MATLSSKLEILLAIYLRLKVRPSQHLANGHYMAFCRPSLTMLLDKLEIPYTSKPGKGIIFFKWHDTNQLPKEIIEDKYYEYAYELVDLHRPFHICNKAEYDLICVLFSLNSRSPTFEIRPTDRLFLM